MTEKATVLVAFRDRLSWRGYEPGDAYEGEAGRVAELVGVGFLTRAVVGEVRPDLAGLTNARLLELCAERGIEAPKKATKTQLVALLGK